jgi:hypothetical protein
MKNYLGAMVLALAAGCGNGATNTNDMGLGDLPVAMDFSQGDGPVGNGKIGAACAATTDCKEGMAPVCWKHELFNSVLYLPVPGGYCSSTCTADTDCGSNGTCTDFGTVGKFCLAKCTQPSDCRAPSYGCFTGNKPSCFPVANLDCDPTAGDGSCLTTPKGRAGGCERAILGGPTVNSGKTGICAEECEAGTNTCAPDSNGPRKCLVDDERQNVDQNMQLFGDKWAGPVCFAAPAAGTPLFQDGQECTCMVNGMSQHCIDVCVDGSECYVQSTTTDMKQGDNLCHAFCYFGAMSIPDGGYNYGDAGVIAATTCPGATVCTDVYGLKTTNRPVGLCL